MTTPPESGATEVLPDEMEVKIRGLMMDPVTNMPMVVLKDIQSDALVPIWVGIFEANAIALEIEKTAMPRPMTHDLLANLIRTLDGEVRRVVITELKDDVFYALIWMEQGGELISLDARPSDALALALRTDCPIFLSAQVLRTTRMANAGVENFSTDELRRWLENLNDEDLAATKCSNRPCAVQVFLVRFAPCRNPHPGSGKKQHSRQSRMPNTCCAAGTNYQKPIDCRFVIFWFCSRNPRWGALYTRHRCTNR